MIMMLDTFRDWQLIKLSFAYYFELTIISIFHLCVPAKLTPINSMVFISGSKNI